MKSLQILRANNSCGIDQAGIKGINLEKLYACHNSKIKDVSFMKSLEVLGADSNCGIDQWTPSNFKLV